MFQEHYGEDHTGEVGTGKVSQFDQTSAEK